MKNFFLTRERKLKLIEVLLIVATLLAALKIPDSLLWTFAFFVMFSVLLYTSLQAGSVDTWGTKGLSFIVALGFAAITTYFFSLSILKSVDDSSPVAGLTGISAMISVFLYLPLLTYALYKALTSRDFFK